MQAPRVDIISIGCLSRNRLWNETAASRSPHATTSLIRAGARTILIDPGLPGAILAAKLNERTGLSPDAIDTIFLTNFRPSHRGGIGLFEHAQWLIGEVEQDSTTAQLSALIDDAPEEDEDRAHLQRELELLQRFRPAPDKLVEGVDLFPLFGYTAGTCGLLISSPTVSTLIAGDAVPTLDHFLAGQVLPDSHDIQAAQESLREAYEIADLIVAGHDNLFLNPRMMGM